MNVRPGVQLLTAPHFPPVTDWADRLRISAGVRIEGDSAFPREPWHLPGEENLSRLVRNPDLPLYPSDLEASLALLNLPRRLLSLWWQWLEMATTSPDRQGFEGFLRQLCEFLAFKNLLPVGGVQAEVLAVSPRSPSIHVDATRGTPVGLRWTSDLWGLIHLGDGPAQIVFLNSRVNLDAEPDYPVVAVRLSPGEGVRLPRENLLLDAQSCDDAPGLWLLLRDTERASVRDQL